MIVLKAFKEAYNGFEQPFERADAILTKMNDAQRSMYYDEIHNVISSESFKNEVREWKRGLVDKLAMEEVTKEQRDAYRCVLIQIKEFEARLLSIAQRRTAVRVGSVQSRLDGRK